jgi:hypothetical protein
MNIYFENLSLGLAFFYLVVAMLIGALLSLLSRVFTNKPINKLNIAILFTITIYIIFLALILTDSPSTGGR